MTIIPFFSAIEINQIEDYIRYRNLKLYIQSRSKLVPTSMDLMKLVGYGNLQKFRDHRSEFDRCQRDIPLSYLKAIGVELDVMKFCFELDQEEFERTKNLNQFFPKYATMRYAPAIYGTKRFQPGTSETEAIAQLTELCKETKLSYAINYPNFKTIWISKAGESVIVTYYPPEYKITKTKLVLGRDGYGIGHTSLK